MGGLNRRWLKDPQPLEYRDNPEHGLRLILTFEPQTSFLVPVDRCVALARAGIFAGASSDAGGGAGGPAAAAATAAIAAGDGHYRRQALRFLHVCLASMLNLRVREVEEDAAAVEAARGAGLTGRGSLLRGSSVMPPGSSLTLQSSGPSGTLPGAASLGAGLALPSAGGAGAGAGADAGAAGAGAGAGGADGEDLGAAGSGPSDPALVEAGMDVLLKVVTGELPPPTVAVAMPKVRAWGVGLPAARGMGGGKHPGGGGTCAWVVPRVRRSANFVYTGRERVRHAWVPRAACVRC